MFSNTVRLQVDGLAGSGSYRQNAAGQNLNNFINVAVLAGSMKDNSTAVLSFKNVNLDICGISATQTLGGKTLEELDQTTIENTSVQFNGNCKALV